MFELIILIVSLGIILLGAEIFTNGVEWLGKKLRLSEGAVGSILAAVGTALPETMIPVIAILFGEGEAGHDIGIGAILGAPFMLSTLAFFITGVAVIIFKKQHHNYPNLNVDPQVIKRDLGFFILVYTIAILAAFFSVHTYKIMIALGLVIAYGIYVFFTLVNGQTLGEEHHINPLFFDRKNIHNPRLNRVILQTLFALAVIIAGAKIFVNDIEQLSVLLGIPSFVLALIIAPIATELPEKFNSIIWVSKGKDTLALGNITGAMVFQSSLIPALGIALTPWMLDFKAIISAVLALLSATIIYLQLLLRNRMTPFALLFGGAIYGIFVLLVIIGVIR
ncbi:MAG: cation:H+ antiporter [Clostridia bacterium]|jgi:cation:H+ antiporter|nr:Sodium/calcium exchanger rane region [Clostridiales bacterium]MDK2986671.1 cation:H+ antiporter [Clostridia bacterium]